MAFMFTFMFMFHDFIGKIGNILCNSTLHTAAYMWRANNTRMVRYNLCHTLWLRRPTRSN